MKLGQKMPYAAHGEWKESKTKKYMPVSDSSTGEVIAEIPCCTIDEVEAAIQSANDAVPAT